MIVKNFFLKGYIKHEHRATTVAYLKQQQRKNETEMFIRNILLNMVGKLNFYLLI